MRRPGNIPPAAFVVPVGRGFGFIARQGEPDVVVHYSEIDGNGFRSLDENQAVESEVSEGPQATQVRSL